MKVIYNNNIVDIKEKLKQKLKNTKDKQDVILVGPFIGELSWELYRFVPYIIYLKKNVYTRSKFIILTRPTRIDLYGKYADILVPLIIDNKYDNYQNCFRIDKFPKKDYKMLINNFYNRYSYDYNIKEHIYPDITSYHYKLKWQFSREKTDYEFMPRNNNIKFIKKFIEKNDKIILVNDIKNKYNLDGFKTIYLHEFINEINNGDITFLGCLIELIKKCEFVISNFNNTLTQLSLLLKIPVVLNDNKIVDPYIVSTYNPFETKITYLKGIE